MKILCIVTLFILGLLVSYGRVERFTDERFEKVLKQEEKHFFEFMGEKGGKAYDGYRSPTRARINRIRSTGIKGAGKKMNLRSAIVTGIVLNNLKPTYEECIGVKNPGVCRREKRKQVGKVLGDYVDYRLKKLKPTERKGFRNDSKAMVLHYLQENE